MHEWRRVCAAVAALAAACAGARAGDVRASLAAAPADAEIVVVLDGATELRRSEVGSALEQGVRALASPTELAQAWRGLAAQLQLDEEVALDKLLGRHVMLVQRGSGAETTWALVSVVDGGTEARIRDRLRPAPRRVEQGAPVLSLEDGRFWLAMAPVKGGALVLLGPSERPAMFEQMLGSLGKPARPSVLDTALGERVKRLPADATGLAAARLGQAGWIAATATSAERRLRVEVSMSSRELDAALARIEPWSRAGFDVVAKNAYVALAEWGGDPAIPSASVVLQQAGELSRVVDGFAGRPWLGPRRAIVVSPSERAAADILLALESTDLQQLAPVADKAAAQLIGGLVAGETGLESNQAADFEGLFPQAVRRIDLSRPLRAWLGAIYEEGPALSWVYGVPGATSVHRGWWTIVLGPGDAGDAATLLGGPLSDPADPSADRWISVGSARPAALVAEIGRRGVPLPATAGVAAEALRLVESVTWSLRRDETGGASGKAEILIARPGRKPAP
ncbi:MAG: hypothetical protein SFZ24_10655 [Planctomycetota bacterium]|nr:hypothetical protein [Planctomycetota bacterium]